MDLVKTTASGITLDWNANTSPGKGHIAHPFEADFVPQDLQALIEFWQHLQPIFAGALPAAVSLPFATLPLNYYVRESEALKALPEPTDLQDLVDAIRHNNDRVKLANRIRGCVRAAERIFMRVDHTPEIERVPVKGSEYTANGGTVRVMPARVMSPRLVIDADELNCRTLGLMLTVLYRAPCDASQRRTALAIKAAAESGRQYGPIVGGREAVDVHVKREAFMLELTSWATGFGAFTTPDGKPIEPISCESAVTRVAEDGFHEIVSYTPKQS